MRLALVALKNVNNVNSFDEAVALRLTQGNPTTLYLRVVDLDQPLRDTDQRYLRYIPAVGATMQVTVKQIDSNNEVIKVAVQPFLADDRSIWSIQILATDAIQFNNLEALLTVSGATYKLPVISSIVSDPSGTNKFFC